jgi:hypothetical protein
MANAKSIRVILSAIISAWILCNSVADAATYYAAPTGPDTLDCVAAQTTGGARSIRRALECAAPGDTVQLLDGTYNRNADRVSASDFVVPNGTAAAPITVQGNGSATILQQQPGDGEACVHLRGRAYLTFKNFVCNGIVGAGTQSPIYVSSDWGPVPPVPSQYITFEDVVVRNSFVVGVAWGKPSHHITFRRGKVHDIGMLNPEGHYAFYINGADALIEDVEIFNIGSWAIHAYDNAGSHDTDRNIFRRNRIHHFGSTRTGAGILVGWGEDNVIENNVVYAGFGAGIQGWTGSTNTSIRHNTVVGVDGSAFEFAWYDGAPGEVKKNIAFNNGNNGVVWNLSAAPVVLDNLFGIDPQFANIAADDFRLTAASPARNVGANIAVATDIVGTARPQESVSDIGAYEFPAEAPPPPPTNNPPLVGAGVDQTITLPATASLNGSASDDGLPNPPATLTRTWSKVSGPGTVTFSNPNILNPTATFSAAGVYVLRLTASDSALQATDELTVTVNAAPPPPPSGTTYKWITMPTNSGAAAIESTLANWAAQGWFYAGHGHSGNNGTTLTILLQRTQ